MVDGSLGAGKLISRKEEKKYHLNEFEWDEKVKIIVEKIRKLRDDSIMKFNPKSDEIKIPIDYSLLDKETYKEYQEFLKTEE